MERSKVVPVVGVVDIMLSSLTGGKEVTTRVIWVGSTVSSDGHKKGHSSVFLNMCVLFHVVYMCFCAYSYVCITWLKGDLTEHHPNVSEVKAAAEGLSGPPIQWHRDVSGTRVSVIQHRFERHHLRLPASDEAGLKPAGDGGEDLHATGEHVVTVNLDRVFVWLKTAQVTVTLNLPWNYRIVFLLVCLKCRCVFCP